MGFKDRGDSRFCFATYDSSSNEEDDENDFDFNLPVKRNKSRHKYYSGPIRFKANYNGIGYVASTADHLQGKGLVVTYKECVTCRNGEGASKR